MLGEFVTLKSAVFAVFVMGLGCGSGCSPAISSFLMSYTIHVEGEPKQTFRAFLDFFVGKTVAILICCMISAMLGYVIAEDGVYFGRYSIDGIMPLFLIVVGIYMIYKCVQERKGSGCRGCKSCGKKFNNKYPLVGGFLYGLTPCAPMLMLMGCAVTMSFTESILLGIIFSLACMCSPLLFMLVFTKLISSKMAKETPTMFLLIKIILSIMVFGMGIVNFYQIIIS